MAKPHDMSIRDPLPPPFPVGARIRYVGDRRHFADREMTAPLLVHGMEFDVVDTAAGRRGTGRVITTGEDGEPIRDRTRDGYSVYVNARNMRCAVVHGALSDWQLVTASRVADATDEP